VADYNASIRLTAEDAASPAIQRIGQTVSGLFGQLTALAGIAGGAFSFGAAIKTGIEFNSVMEDTKAGIAALLLANQDYTTSTGEAATQQQAMNAAMSQASEIQAQLKTDALTTAASYEELTKAFQAALGPALTAGVTNIDQVRQITVAAAQAMQALSIPTHQAAQELRALFTGETGPDNRLNQVLRITRDEINKVRASGGDLAEFYLNKLRPFTEAAAEATANFSVRMSNLKDRLGQVLGEASKPLFDVLKKQLVLADEAAAGFQQKLNEMGRVIADLVTKYSPLIQSLIQFGVVAADAGLKFLQALNPLLPAVKLLVDGITAITDALGPMTIGVYLAVKAWLALQGAASALAVITSTVTTGFIGLTGSILTATVASAPLAAVLGTIGAVAVVTGAAIVALKLYFVDLREENKKVAVSFGNLKDNTQTLIDTLSAKFPDNANIVKLGKDLAAAKTDDEITKVNDAAQKLARSLRGTTEEVKSNVKAVGEAAKKWGEWKQPIIDIADKVKDYIDKDRSMFQSVSENLVKLKGMWNLSALEKIQLDGQQEQSEIRKIETWMKANKEFFDKNPELQRQMIAAMERARKEAGDREKLALDKHLYEVQGIYENHTPLFKAAMVSGFVTGMTAVAAQIPTMRQTWEGALTTAWTALAATFDKAFFSVLKGDMDGLKETFQSFGDALLGIFSKVFSDIAQRWLATKLGFEMGPNGQWQVGKGGGGLGMILGVAGAGAFAGYGFGSSGSGATVGSSIAGAAGGAALATGLAAMAGLITIPIAGWIVAAVGAILLAVSSLLKKSTQEWSTLIGGQVLSQSTEAGMQLWNAYGKTLGSLAGIMRTGGGKGTDLISMLRWNSDEFLRSTNIKWGSGDPKDTQVLWETYLKNWFPKTLLSMAFGRQPTGGFESFAGVGANMQGVPTFAGGAGDTPLTRMMRDLGFTTKALDAIANQIDTRDAEEFIAWLDKLVGVVKGFKDLSANFKKTAAEIWGDLAAQEAKTPADLFAEGASRIVDLAAELDLYTGDEQLTKAAELVELAQQYYNDQVAYLSSLRELQKSITESVNQQIRGMRLDVMTPGQRESFLMGETQGLIASLAKATSPAEISKIMQQIQANISSIFSASENKAGILDAMEALLRSAEAAASARIKELGDSALAANPGLADAMDRAKELFTNMGPSLANVTAAAVDDAAALTANADAANASANALTTLADVVDAAVQSVKEFRAELSGPLSAANPANTRAILRENNRTLVMAIRQNPALIGMA